MKYKKLKNGQKVLELPESMEITINTKCPKQWAFVDMETGDVWVHNSRLPKKENKFYGLYAADEKAWVALWKIIYNHYYPDGIANKLVKNR